MTEYAKRPSTVVATVAISALRPADSPRAGEVDPQHVRKLMTARGLPPIVAHRSTMRVIDGMHRLRAAELLGRSEIEVLFFEGTDAEAFVLAVQSNVRHGLQLSRGERSAAARRIMTSHPDWSDRAISVAAGLSVKTVAEIRQRATGDIPQLHTRIGLDGRVRPVDGTAGRRRAAAFIQAHPDASLRQIASAVGISTGTARNVRERLRQGESPVPAGRAGRPAAPDDAAGGAAPPSPLVPRQRRAGPDDGAPPPDGPRGDALLALRRDPSLRFTEAGRLVLRLLDNRALADAEGDRVIRGIPPYRRGTLAAAVRDCVAVWDRFARELELADRGDSRPA
ncbi:ParB/RepB/Spo0J family partition protein [Kitasatospora sp. NPDC056327]|uniref:ParB/RepB/Spo0J family partition protein n=1 Tax=Kitasatospora sp. NPDC056327 TaxID=3345785 RepID=UPI0035E36A33